MRSFDIKEMLRFAGCGTLSTVVTYVCYLGLLIFIQYPAAFTISYIIGVLVSYIGGTKYVFKAKHSSVKALIYPFVYVLQYVTGLYLLHLLIITLGMSEEIAPIIVYTLTFPITFLLSKFILNSDI